MIADLAYVAAFVTTLAVALGVPAFLLLAIAYRFRALPAWMLEALDDEGFLRWERRS